MGSRVAFVVNALTGPELSGGRADATHIHRLLLDSKFGGCDRSRSPAPLYECGSRTAFNEALHAVLQDLKHGDQLVFYFSGHGTYRNDEYCLLFGDKPSHHLRFDNIMGDISTYEISRALIILDACHSGAVLARRRKAPIPFYQPSTQDIPRGIAILSSCLAAETSAELPDGSASVFTHLLCQAIESGLDGTATNSGFISVGDAVNYINARLETDDNFKGYSQNPAYGVQGARGDIWIAHNRSGSITDAITRQTPAITSIEGLRIAYDSTSHSRRPCQGALAKELNLNLATEFARRTAPNVLKQGPEREELAARLDLFSVIPIGTERFLHNAAVLCFCDSPERYFPQARATFVAGDHASKDLDLEQVTGPLSAQIKRLVDLTMRTLRTRASFGGSERVEYDELPIEVIREAISNAITHRDYQATGTVQVNVTPESVDVINPGSFPVNCSWGHFLNSRPVSCPADAAIAYFVNGQFGFEGIGRGFSIFRDFLSRNGPQAITCELHPGPTIAVRIFRPKLPQLNKAETAEFESRFIASMQTHLSASLEVPVLHSALPYIERRVETGSQVVPASAELLGASPRILLRGAAGSGKTTFLVALISQLLQRKIGDSKPVPVLAPLREYEGRGSFIHFLNQQIAAVGAEVPPPHYLESLLQSGRAILLLDGLDEIARDTDKTRALHGIDAICRLYPRAVVVITSRDAGHQSDDLELPDFEEVRLLPLDVAGIHAIADARLKNAQSRIQFVEAVQQVDELKSNPLFLSLAADLFERRGGRLPTSLVELIEEYCAIILHRWDAEKGIREAPNGMEHNYILSSIAFGMIANEERVIERDKLQQRAIDALFEYGHSPSAANELAKNFTSYYLGRSGILGEFAPSRFHFSHSIFLEFYAALYISDKSESADDLLRSIGPRLVASPSDRVAIFAGQLWTRRSLGRLRNLDTAIENGPFDKAALERLRAELRSNSLGYLPNADA